MLPKKMFFAVMVLILAVSGCTGDLESRKERMELYDSNKKMCERMEKGCNIYEYDWNDI